jgi:hypothetical protein
VSVDQNSGIITIFSQFDPSVSLKNLRDEEETLSKQFSDWTIRVLPSQQRIPPLFFDFKETTLSPETMRVLDDIVWALDRWEIIEIEVIGYVNLVGNPKANKMNTLKRTDTVASYLEKEGFSVSAKTRFFPPFHTKRKIGKTMKYGEHHAVEIELKAHPSSLLGASK